ncbi:MAG TPA: Ni/Fe hydrogenase subunit alpha [Desulfuromonadaceae bacterium]|jgi:NAD-reducing hydrogenase large subunit
MSRTITIAPVTRIEGHAKVTIRLGDAGEVSRARLHVQEFRGFEGFCVGRPYWEMPAIAARICGICPTSHALAASLAGDQILALTPPLTAQKLRSLLSLAQLILSHSLSFFHLSAPDIILGLDFDPAERNLVGLARYVPEAISKGIRLRQIGQEIVNQIAGGELHPEFIVPGGMREPLSNKGRDYVARLLPEAMQLVRYALDLWHEHQGRFQMEMGDGGDFESLFLGLVSEAGALDYTSGMLHFVDGNGATVQELSPVNYGEVIYETVTGDSYMKPTSFGSANLSGQPSIYRVGPLARLNVAPFPDAPLALKERQLLFAGQASLSASLCYHPARLIEMLFAVEKIGQLIEDADICNVNVLVRGEVNNREGVGITEAPRGTLIHHYRVDQYGLLTEVCLIVATAHNSAAMDRTITDIASKHIGQGKQLSEGVLNRVEHGIRIYDPCLSCATHAAGRSWLSVELQSADGKVLDRAWR